MDNRRTETAIEAQLREEVKLFDVIFRDQCEGNITTFIRRVALISVATGNRITDFMFENDALRERVREILENDYVSAGKRYRKIGRDEKIKEGALHSWHNGKLNPITDIWTVGDTPSSFARERDFYNPLP